jgi:hypothetical protein
MSGQNIIICSDKSQKMYCRNYKIHTHRHDVELQFGAVIWATTKAEKINKDENNAATRRDISWPTDMQVDVSFWKTARGPLWWKLLSTTTATPRSTPLLELCAVPNKGRIQYRFNHIRVRSSFEYRQAPLRMDYVNFRGLLCGWLCLMCMLMYIKDD